jgi:type II secretory pathway pseudopilin PulG
MAALLVGLSVMSVMMAAALPVWSHATRREREEELIWRGEQYRRAIMLFQRKYANTFPPTVDILVEQKFLRKKYKDPITGDDFQIIPVGGALPGAGGPGAPQPGTRPPAGQPGAGGGPGTGGFGGPGAGGFGSQPGGPGSGFGSQPGGLGAGGFGAGQQQAGGFGQVGGGVAGTQPNMGIQGVTSKSKETSIKQYNGMTKYNQWAFVYLAASGQAGFGGAQFQRPGQGVNQPGAGGFGQPGGVGQPGGFGQPGGGFGQPGGGFGQPGSGFGQPGGGFGQPAPTGPPGSSGFGQPGGFGQPATQPKFPAPPGGGFGTPVPPPSGTLKPPGASPFGQSIPPR